MRNSCTPFHLNSKLTTEHHKVPVLTTHPPSHLIPLQFREMLRQFIFIGQQMCDLWVNWSGLGVHAVIQEQISAQRSIC